MNITRISHYKRAEAAFRDIPTFLKNAPKVYGYFQYQTKTNYNELSSILKIGSSEPEIIPVLNLENKSGRICWGQFSRKTNKISIRENLLMGLEMAKLESTIYNTSFLLAVTILHEIIHYMRKKKNMDDGEFEPGNDFERWSFGSMINDDNAHSHNIYRHCFNNIKMLIQHDKNVIHDIKSVSKQTLKKQSFKH